MNLAKNIQYILDTKGKKTHAILTMDVLESLLEDLEDVKEAKSRKKEKKVSYEEMKTRLTKNGKL